jgi:hypothetical protein
MIENFSIGERVTRLEKRCRNDSRLVKTYRKQGDHEKENFMNHLMKRPNKTGKSKTRNINQTLVIQ